MLDARAVEPFAPLNPKNCSTIRLALKYGWWKLGQSSVLGVTIYRRRAAVARRKSDHRIVVVLIGALFPKHVEPVRGR